MEIRPRCHNESVLTVSGRASRLRCAYCHAHFAASEARSACPGCGAIYHPDCWRQELRQCASVGCRHVAARALRPAPPPEPLEGLGWTFVPWLLLPGGLLSMSLLSGGWVAQVLVSLGTMTLVLTVGWAVLVAALVKLGLAGRR